MIHFRIFQWLSLGGLTDDFHLGEMAEGGIGEMGLAEVWVVEMVQIGVGVDEVETVRQDGDNVGSEIGDPHCSTPDIFVFLMIHQVLHLYLPFLDIACSLHHILQNRILQNCHYHLWLLLVTFLKWHVNCRVILSFVIPLHLRQGKATPGGEKT